MPPSRAAPLLLLLLGPALAAPPPAGDWPADALPDAVGLRAVARDLVLRATAAARRAATLSPEQAKAASTLVRDALAGARGDESSLADKIRQAIREGLPEIGLLPLDPADIGDLPLDIAIPDTATMSGRASGLRLVGLADFVASADLKVHLWPSLALDAFLDLRIPSLDLLGTYDVKGNAAGVLDIWGEGDLRLSLVNVTMLANVSVALKGLSAKADGKSKLMLDLQRIDVDLTGLFEPEDEPSDGELSRVLSEVIGEMLTEALDYVKGVLSEEVSDIGLSVLNSVLANMTVADLSTSFSHLAVLQSRKKLG